MEPIVSMTGRLGTEVELRTARNGHPFATFRMASTNRIVRDGQWVDGPTTWISVRCYRGLGENVNFSLRKGQTVLVTGRLRTDSWADESGAPRERVVLEALAVGHDLNWGIGTLRRPAREEVGSAPAGPGAAGSQCERGQADESGETSAEQGSSQAPEARAA